MTSRLLLTANVYIAVLLAATVFTSRVDTDSELIRVCLVISSFWLALLLLTMFTVVVFKLGPTRYGLLWFLFWLLPASAALSVGLLILNTLQ